MPRRIDLLVAVFGLCTAVALAAWLKGRDEQPFQRPLPPSVYDWESTASNAPVDPAAAISTIRDLRSQFGSVLANSELDRGSTASSGVDSFDDFLRVEAGVSPALNDPALNDPAQNDPAQNDPAQNDPAQNDPAQNDPATTVSSVTSETEKAVSGELATSLRETATLLVERAKRAAIAGDTASELRFSGLATLLRAEAAELTGPDQVDH